MRGLLLAEKKLWQFSFDPRIFRKINTQKQDHPTRSVGFRERG
jgi:hypothetical protein